MMTPPEIEEAYHALLRCAFPYKDCRYLGKKCEVDIEAFTNDLQGYWARIAGFASSAPQLPQRAQLQLYWGLQTLMHGFFESFPQYAELREAITEKKTPDLWEQMNIYEEQRKSLTFLLRQSCWLYADALSAAASNMHHAA